MQLHSVQRFLLGIENGRYDCQEVFIIKVGNAKLIILLHLILLSHYWLGDILLLDINNPFNNHYSMKLSNNV